MKPITMIVVNWVKPECVAQYKRLSDSVLDVMRYEATFVNTVVHQDAEDSTRFMLYETWADRDEFFDIQMKKSYRSDLERILPSLLRVPREISFFEPLCADFNFHNLAPN